jgi:hypothetical protein
MREQQMERSVYPLHNRTSGIKFAASQEVVKCRVGHNCIHTPYMTVCIVISLPKTPCIHREYMGLANPRFVSANSEANVTCKTAGCKNTEVSTLTCTRTHTHTRADTNIHDRRSCKEQSRITDIQTSADTHMDLGDKQNN